MIEKSRITCRIIIDHLAKTGGHSINECIANICNKNAVADGLIGDHENIINSYGGNHSIISGHIWFHGEGLHPGWMYATVLRQPVNRTISWLSYLIYDVSQHEPENLLCIEAKKFVDGDDFEMSLQFRESIQNYYVNHFASIVVPRIELDNCDQLDWAINAIGNYDLIGFTDNLDEFCRNFAKIINVKQDINPSKTINKTSRSIDVGSISKSVYNKIVEYNNLDIDFYNYVQKIVGLRDKQH
tara:strand:+ start:1177 stop:1902 length:726 start_codon:yes stop_codon:yes gene_type:complete